ncbi:MAG: hypothetical protein ACE366_12110 [Bradymonadia bacterium]
MHDTHPRSSTLGTGLSIKGLLSLSLALTLATGCTIDSSQPLIQPPSSGHGAPSQVGPWSLSVNHNGGGALPTYQHQGVTYVEGMSGQGYSVRISNPTAQRVEAVITVDGRDVISGQVGDFAAQRGYIIEPYGHVDVRGFRKNWSEVASFRFTAPGDSYAGRMGSPQHIGVIGAAIFREKVQPMAHKIAPAPTPGFGDMAQEAEDVAAAEPMPARRRQNIGTQYGHGVVDHAVEVPFVRADAQRPEALLAVYYDDREGLIARGVQIRRPTAFAPPPPGSPSPFPGHR